MPQNAVITVQVDGCNYGVEDAELPAPGGQGMVRVKKVNFVVPRSPEAESGAAMQISVIFTPDAFREFAAHVQSAQIAVATPADVARIGNLNGFRHN